MDRKIVIAQCQVSLPTGRSLKISYSLLPEEARTDSGCSMEVYGVCAETDTGENSCVHAITANAAAAEALVAQLASCTVTPCTLQDVIVDLFA